jgi:4-hydroxy-3-methylbut-2-en-1-yl diphosphate reductase
MDCVEEVVLAAPRGFCAGVEMAIKALVWMLRVFEPPVYCYHEIVHNRAVVSAFEAAGVVFVDDVAAVPADAPLMLSAHGSAPQVVADARNVSRFVVDAVCPLVTKVHHEVKVRARKGYEVIYVGHRGHDEAVGTMAVAPEALHLVESVEDVERLELRDDRHGVALLAQTTLSHFDWREILEAARARFPDLWVPARDDLCFATTNRQSAVQAIAPRVDAMVIVGSETSSNTRALVKVARAAGCARSHRVDSPDDVESGMLTGARVVGVTAGASAPEELVADVIARIAPSKGVRVLDVTSEDEYFPPPPDLRELVRILDTLVALMSGGDPDDAIRIGGPFTEDRALAASGALGLV